MTFKGVLKGFPRVFMLVLDSFRPRAFNLPFDGQDGIGTVTPSYEAPFYVSTCSATS